MNATPPAAIKRPQTWWKSEAQEAPNISLTWLCLGREWIVGFWAFKECSQRVVFQLPCFPPGYICSNNCARIRHNVRSLLVTLVAYWWCGWKRIVQWSSNMPSWWHQRKSYMERAWNLLNPYHNYEIPPWKTTAVPIPRPSRTTFDRPMRPVTWVLLRRKPIASQCWWRSLSFGPHQGRQFFWGCNQVVPSSAFFFGGGRGEGCGKFWGRWSWTLVRPCHKSSQNYSTNSLWSQRKRARDCTHLFFFANAGHPQKLEGSRHKLWLRTSDRWHCPGSGYSFSIFG